MIDLRLFFIVQVVEFVELMALDINSEVSNTSIGRRCVCCSLSSQGPRFVKADAWRDLRESLCQFEAR